MKIRTHFLSPLDGRYADKIAPLAEIFCEENLFKMRTSVMVSWLAHMTLIKSIPAARELTSDEICFLSEITVNFSDSSVERIRQLERETKHDVKAVEYFIAEQIRSKSGLESLTCLIHFGCTSEDVNNIAYALIIKKARDKIILKHLTALYQQLSLIAHEHANISMLGHTHGQPATPTTVGKEFANYAARLKEQLDTLRAIKIKAKRNGAVGNDNALVFAVADIDWEEISKEFVESFDLTWNSYTTQIEPHDYIAEFCDCMRHINNILLGLAKDVWQYCSMDYFKLKTEPGQVGSSTMSHKINPIDFENAEGNLGEANALFAFMSDKLPVSRMQRDLSDSTVLRNLGVPMGHTLLALQSLVMGLNKLTPNREVLARDLDNHWEILAEPIQTVMRAYGINDAYEQLKKLTQGKVVTRETVSEFIKSLNLPDDVKFRLLALSPATYIGYAPELATAIIREDAKLTVNGFSLFNPRPAVLTAASASGITMKH